MLWVARRSCHDHFLDDDSGVGIPEDVWTSDGEMSVRLPRLVGWSVEQFVLKIKICWFMRRLRLPT